MIKIDTSYPTIEIDRSHTSIKIETIDIESEYFYLSPFTVHEENKEVKHAISDETI